MPGASALLTLHVISPARHLLEGGACLGVGGRQVGHQLLGCSNGGGRHDATVQGNLGNSHVPIARPATNAGGSSQKQARSGQHENSQLNQANDPQTLRSSNY